MRGDPRNLLPTTGQTNDYSVSGSDGDRQAGFQFNNRFVVSDQSTVFDRVTNLEWAADPPLIFPGGTGALQVARGNWSMGGNYALGDLVADGGLFYACILAINPSNTAPGSDATHWSETIFTGSAVSLGNTAAHNWATFLSFIDGMTWNGHSDWRMPNAMEAASLLNLELSDAIHAPWSGIELAFDYWASTTNAFTTTSAFEIRYRQGGLMQTTAKTNVNAVLPVRGGLHLP